MGAQETVLVNYITFLVRTSRSEFIVSVNKYLEAQSHKLSVGMRFKMTFEGEEVPERRYFYRLYSSLTIFTCRPHLTC